MIRVLFVCLGNICRSPMAEAVFSHKVREAGLDAQISADSAGTGDWHAGSSPHPGTQAMLASENIAYEHSARVLTPADFHLFDIICTMDNANYSAVTRLRQQSGKQGKAVVKPLMEFAPLAGYAEVPDPYYDGNFSRTFDLVGAASNGLLDRIRLEYKI